PTRSTTLPTRAGFQLSISPERRSIETRCRRSGRIRAGRADAPRLRSDDFGNRKSDFSSVDAGGQMMGVKHTRHTEPIWNVARGLVVLTVLTLMGSTYLAAQGGQRPQGQGQGARGQGPGGRGAAPPAAEFVKPTEPGDFS